MPAPGHHLVRIGLPLLLPAAIVAWLVFVLFAETDKSKGEETERDKKEREGDSYC